MSDARPVEAIAPGLGERFRRLLLPGREATSATTAGRSDRVLAGILWMLAASVFFALTSALAKWTVSRYPVGEVMAMRSLSTFAVTALFMLPQTGLSVYRTAKPGSHLARGLSQSISQTFTVIAFSLMPLAGAIAINFSAPIWAAILSLILLRERPGPARWAVLLIGFIGVVIVAAPKADSLQPGALFALANAIMYGSVTVAVRGMTKTESASTLLIWQVTTVAVLHLLLLLFGFIMPTPVDAAMLLAGGLTNACAQYGWTKALSLAPTAAVSPFYYFTLFWVVAIGFVVWGDVPSLSLTIGAAIIVVSGLLLLFYETRRRTASA